MYPLDLKWAVYAQQMGKSTHRVGKNAQTYGQNDHLSLGIYCPFIVAHLLLNLVQRIFFHHSTIKNNSYCYFDTIKTYYNIRYVMNFNTTFNTTKTNFYFLMGKFAHNVKSPSKIVKTLNANLGFLIYIIDKIVIVFT